MNITSFLSTTLYLEEEGLFTNHWSQGVTRHYQTQKLKNSPTSVGQILDHSILYEISLLTKIPENQLEYLNYPLQGNMKEFKTLLAILDFLEEIEKLNLVATLFQISRFKFAQKIFLNINLKNLPLKYHPFYLTTDFVIKNRLGLKNNYHEEFLRFKNLLEEYDVSPENTLQLCSQAIVWASKTKNNDLTDWFESTALKAIPEAKTLKTNSSYAALSSFYRGYAMIFADRGDIAKTREIMLSALAEASKITPQNDIEEFVKFNLIKTYHESSVKEYLYVKKDLEAALESAHKIIELDPHWSISHQELADIYLKMKKYDQALKCYERSLEIGLPRISFAQYMKGLCLEKQGDFHGAIVEYKKNLKFDPLAISSGVSGYNLALKYNNPFKKVFSKSLQLWNKFGYITPEIEKVIAST